MNILSKPDLTSAAQYGRYIDFVASKKMGCHTPVRRSCRHRQATPHHSKHSKGIDVSVEDDRDDSGTENNDESFCDNSVDELCTMFQTTLKVNNHTLEVNATDTNPLSPEPTLGRYVTVADKKSSTVTPVKRSKRNVSFSETKSGE
jgi:hypothetical protein